MPTLETERQGASRVVERMACVWMHRLRDVPVERAFRVASDAPSNGFKTRDASPSTQWVA